MRSAWAQDAIEGGRLVWGGGRGHGRDLTRIEGSLTKVSLNSGLRVKKEGEDDLIPNIEMWQAFWRRKTPPARPSQASESSPEGQQG